MVLAVPTVVAANQVSNQLVRNTAVYNQRLLVTYAVESGVELGLASLLDKDFRDVLVPGEHPVELSMQINGEDITVEISAFSPGEDGGGESESADIVMVLDNSASIDTDELVDLKYAANTMVDAFTLEDADGRMAMGLTRFAGSSEGLVEMTVDPDQMHSGINALIAGALGLAPKTNIVEGIVGGADQLSTGLGDRPGVANILIFITDGDDKYYHTPNDISSAAEASGAEIFAIGVGSNINMDTLYAIAYDPFPDDALDPDAGHVYHTDDFDDLQLIIDELVEEILVAAATASIYVIESVSANGSDIRVYVSVAPDGTATVLSYQSY